MAHFFRLSIQASFLIIGLLIFSVSGCKNKSADQQNQLPPETLAEYVSGYTSGVIGKRQSIVVQFSQQAVEQIDVGQEVEASWVKLSPNIAYTSRWKDRFRLEISPQTHWEEEKQYTLSIALAKIFPNADIDRDFVSQFEIRPTQISVVFEGLYTPDANNAHEQELIGTIRSNDKLLGIEGLEKIFTATLKGKKLPVSISSDPDNEYIANVRVLDVKRSRSGSNIEVSWDASKVAGLGNEANSQRFYVSSVSEFKVVSVEAKQEGHIEVILTDPVSTEQDINGLITIDGARNLRLTKDANRIRIYPSKGLEGMHTVSIDASLKSSTGPTLGTDGAWQITFTSPDPEIRIASDGVIMPHTGQRLFPFEAIGLKAVRVEIFKIFGSNVQQFLDRHNIYGNQGAYGLNQVGRIIHQERILLSSLKEGTYEMDKWNRFALDLGRFIEDDDRAIYQVRIGFAMKDARKACDKTSADFGISYVPASGKPRNEYIGFEDSPKSILGNYYGIYGERYQNFDWDDRDDPCRPAYYNEDRFICRNVLCSNLGLIVKQNNDRQTVVIVTDLISGGPVVGAEVLLYDEQQQKIYNETTDADGRILVETLQQPTFVVARYNEDVAYLELDQGNALNMSRFPTSGVSVAGGVKGSFYAERGVWRPGDSIYLNFVLENSLLKLPSNYPIQFTLKDSRGNVRDQRTVTPASGQNYPLYLATEDDDPTGLWRAEVEVGGKKFVEFLQIETIKPNRLKVNLEPLQAGALTRTNNRLKIEASWLHGAPAANLQTTVIGQLQESSGAFKAEWPDYVFLDPARSLGGAREKVLFDETLSATGTAQFSIEDMGTKLPGPLRMAFNTRVFESGGDFSADNVRYDLVTFNALAGLSLPEGRWGGKRLPMDTDNDVAVVAIDAKGKGLANQQLEVGLYRVDWRYWWQDDNDDVARYNSSTHERALETYQVRTGSDGRAVVKVRTNKWGRYLLRVCNTQSGHCTGDYFYSGSPRWVETDKDAAAMLPLRVEDKTYSVGESATLNIATENGGMVLLSLENSSGVIETRWVKAENGTTNIPVKLNETMLPTVYASVMLIQPHANTKNDGPIRRYGVLPIKVEDPETHLKPTIVTASEYEPEENFSVTVAEKDGQAMTYTLAVVDEGLLGLTRFKTPDLWSNFFGKEALTVKTYDLFNHVISSMDGQFNRILAVGGDDEIGDDGDKAKANRFEPVVKHLGPFQLKAGQEVRHDFTMPNYVGAVRVMLVAHSNRKYGKAEKTVPVRKDLMVLPTLPRVLSPGERIELPVNVFAMTGKVKDVEVVVREENGLMTNEVAKTQAIRFNTPGDQLLRFPFQVGSESGVARFVVTAKGNGQSISQDIEVQVENPNGVETREEEFVLDAGSSKNISYSSFGSSSTRDITLELSLLPNLKLNRHINYLIRYPYGCVEQTTSSVFPQLNLGKLVDLSKSQEEQLKKNIQAGIHRLQQFQLKNGGLGYWRNANTEDKWGTTYALHFLLEAEAAGYSLPIGMKARILDFQTKASNSWRYENSSDSGERRYNTYNQAYRLFTLALANQPNIGAMNRMRGVKTLSSQAKAFLAAAYKLAGKENTAKEMAKSIDAKIEDYRELGYTYGSSIRDGGVMLYTLRNLGIEDKLGGVALKLAKQVNKRTYLSTQEGAFVILAFSKYLENLPNSTNNVLKVTFNTNGQAPKTLGADNGFFVLELNKDDGTHTFDLSNTGSQRVFCTILNTAKPLPGEETVDSKGIDLSIAYTDLDGKPIDVSVLKSGTDFIATYRVRKGNVSYYNLENMALQQIAASGWEISNERMSATDMNSPENNDGDWKTSNTYNYRDFRDDRVFTFFDLYHRSQKVYRLRMTAAYPGRYYLPTQIVEAMYDPEVRSAVKGRWVEVLAP